MTVKKLVYEMDTFHRQLAAFWASKIIIDNKQVKVLRSNYLCVTPCNAKLTSESESKIEAQVLNRGKVFCPNIDTKVTLIT